MFVSSKVMNKPFGRSRSDVDRGRDGLKMRNPTHVREDSLLNTLSLFAFLSLGTTLVELTG